MESLNTQAIESKSSELDGLEESFAQALHISKDKKMDDCSQDKIVIQNYLSGMTVNDSKPCLQDNYDVGF
jgi:hypothetical protein